MMTQYPTSVPVASTQFSDQCFAVAFDFGQPDRAYLGHQFGEQQFDAADDLYGQQDDDLPHWLPHVVKDMHDNGIPINPSTLAQHMRRLGIRSSPTPGHDYQHEYYREHMRNQPKPKPAPTFTDPHGNPVTPPPSPPPPRIPTPMITPRPSPYPTWPRTTRFSEVQLETGKKPKKPKIPKKYVPRPLGPEEHVDHADKERLGRETDWTNRSATRRKYRYGARKGKNFSPNKMFPKRTTQTIGGDE